MKQLGSVRAVTKAGPLWFACKNQPTMMCAEGMARDFVLGTDSPQIYLAVTVRRCRIFNLPMLESNFVAKVEVECTVVRQKGAVKT